MPANGPSNQADEREFAKRFAGAKIRVGCLGPHASADRTPEMRFAGLRERDRATANPAG